MGYVPAGFLVVILDTTTEEQESDTTKKGQENSSEENRIGQEGERRKSYSAAVIDGIKRNTTIYVGDSIIRKTDTRLSKGEDVVVCLPGARIEHVTERVEKIVGRGNGGTILVHVGTNNTEKEGTTAIVEKYRKLLKKTKQARLGQIILSGILPVCGNRIQGYRNSKRMAVNGMVERLCKEEEVGYVDMWDSFVGNEELYFRDGLHLSGKGAAVLAEGLSGAVASGLGKVRYLKLVGQGGKSKKTIGGHGQKDKRSKNIQRNTSESGIKCVCLNARSIINKKTELNIMVDDIKPHIIGITESWANNDITDAELGLEGYVMFRKDRMGRRGGGVLLYIKESIPAYEVQLQEEADCKEALWCNLVTGHTTVTIGVVYRCPNITIQNNEKIHKAISEVSKGDCIIMGDFNHGNIKWDSQQSTGVEDQKFLCLVQDNFLTQHVLEPTRAARVLDIVLSSHKEFVDNVVIQEPLGRSDHNQLHFNINIKSDKTKVKQCRRDFRRGNYDEIRKSLALIDWNDKMNNKTATECWNIVRGELDSAIDGYVPMKKQGKRSKKKHLSKEAFRKIRYKQNMWRVYKHTGTDKDYDAYKEALNAATNEVRKSKRNFEHKLAQNIKSDSKSFYAYVRSKQNVRDKVGPLVDNAGNIITQGFLMAEELNMHFSSVFTREDTSSIPVPETKFKGSEGERLGQLVVTPEVVVSKINNMKENKSPGVDGISPKILKETVEQISTPLAHLFNMSLKEGIVPFEWKEANIIPLFKKGSRNKSVNYRPVSLTSVICKLLETIIRDHMMDFLIKHKLINPSQHGFLKAKSCITNLLCFLEEITKWVVDGSPVDVIYLDFQKAFDKVPHQRLISKLKSHGMGNSIINWIEQWLKDRRQRVVVDGDVSSWKSVLSGVQQGSVLGPILFLVYINDLEEGVTGKILKFADDTKLFRKVKEIGDKQNLQDDIDKLVKWSEKWQMLFNFGKCKCLHTGSGNTGMNYEMGGTILSKSVKEKDLGVTMNANMKVSEQCRIAASKGNQVLGMIRRNITYKEKSLIIPLYKAIVRPHLEYCIQAVS